MWVWLLYVLWAWCVRCGVLWRVDGQAAGSGKPSVARSIIEETMRAKGGKLSAEDEREIASALGALYAGEPFSLPPPLSPLPSPLSSLLALVLGLWAHC